MSSKNPDGQTVSRLCAEFSSLVSPVIGCRAAADLFYRALERGRPDEALPRLDALAAFFAEKFEDTQSLAVCCASRLKAQKIAD